MEGQMTDWRARLERVAGTLELPGLLGLVATVLALAAWAIWVRPVETRQVELAAGVARPAQSAASGARRGDAAASQSTQAYYAAFPPLDSSVRWLAALQQAAIESGVSLDSGAYRLEHPSDLRLVRYHMLLPVSGSYAQIRAFIAATLAALPTVSLDDLQLARAASDPARLDARLSLSLYLQDTP
jgi:hypothetical protein